MGKAVSIHIIVPEWPERHNDTALEEFWLEQMEKLILEALQQVDDGEQVKAELLATLKEGMIR